MELFDSKYFRGQGPLFIAERDAATGLPKGLVFIGDLGSVELTPNVERFEVLENVSGMNNVGASGIKSVRYNFTANMRSVKKEHLAIALGAVLTDKAGASVTDEAHVAYLDKFIPLKHTNVSSVVVTGEGGTPSYVADTDYKVHAEEGMLEILSGGTITDAADIEVDYDYAAQAHLPADPGNVDRYLVFSGINTADNDKQTRCEIYKVQLDPSALSLITDDPAEMPITGVVLRDTLRAAGDQLFSWKVEA